MRIALCSTIVPFVYGGGRNIVEWLQIVLERAGHQVERVYLPEVDEPEVIFEQMQAFRWLDLSWADRVICFRPQSHMVVHPYKIVWFIHHLRVFYDMWSTPYRPYPDSPRFQAVRRQLHAADTMALAEARKVFTNSAIVASRLREFNGVEGEVLYPPVFEADRFHCRGFNDEVLYVCRVEHHKRQHLLLEAMPLTTTPVRLRICGTGSDEGYHQYLRNTIEHFGLAARVSLDYRWISEEEKVELLSQCLAAAYLPVDEDSYGYPSVEASHAGKPILTCSDAGGVLELVTDGENGWVAEPDPVSLAAALDRIWAERAGAPHMGATARARLDVLGISWEHVLERLLA